MPHRNFVLAYYNNPLGCLIDTRKALEILMVHEIHDSRLRLFILKWIAALVVLLGAGICGFQLLPIFLALGVFSAPISLCALAFWFGSQDLFLKFVLEDEGFYNLATQSRALIVLDGTDSDQPQPTKTALVRKTVLPLAILIAH